MSQLPAPIRAALGLVATIVHDGRSLPGKAVELPVLAVSTALQLSLRAQQRYAALTVRGDEFLTELRGGAPDDPPAWATFDEEVAPRPVTQPTERPSASVASASTKSGPTKRVPTKRVPTKSVPTKSAPSKKAPAPAKTTKAARTGEVSNRTAPARKASATAAPVKRPAAKASTRAR